MLVAPDYPGATPDDDPSIIRVPSGGVPRDPEDRRFLGEPLKLALNHALADKVDLVHIHTPPSIAHYAGVRFAREHGLPVASRLPTPSSKTICITTCRSCRAGMGPLDCTSVHALAMRRRRRADFHLARPCAKRSRPMEFHGHRSAAHQSRARREVRAR